MEYWWNDAKQEWMSTPPAYRYDDTFSIDIESYAEHNKNKKKDFYYEIYVTASDWELHEYQLPKVYLIYMKHQVI